MPVIIQRFGRQPASIIERHRRAEPPPDPPEDRGVIKPLGGGWWLLPDGRRIRGREAAEEALSG